MHYFICFQRDAFSVHRTLVVILDLRFDRVKGCDTQMFLSFYSDSIIFFGNNTSNPYSGSNDFIAVFAVMSLIVTLAVMAVMTLMTLTTFLMFMDSGMV